MMFHLLQRAGTFFYRVGLYSLVGGAVVWVSILALWVLADWAAAPAVRPIGFI